MSQKPQVLLRIEDKDGVHFVKKWHHGGYSIEGHTVERSVQHNMNAPDYFFPLSALDVVEEFKKAGKEFRA